jgi:hypothetical protein
MHGHAVLATSLLGASLLRLRLRRPWPAQRRGWGVGAAAPEPHAHTGVAGDTMPAPPARSLVASGDGHVLSR